MSRLRGATVARLTPDQKAACSNHVGVKYFRKRVYVYVVCNHFVKDASAGNRTRVNCLEGSYAHHYTTDASLGG